jgi:hypothetical protein
MRNAGERVRSIGSHALAASPEETAFGCAPSSGKAHIQVALPPTECPQCVDLRLPASPASLAKFTCSARQQSCACVVVEHLVMQSGLSTYVVAHMAMGVHTERNVVQ